VGNGKEPAQPVTTWRVELTKPAADQLAAISDARVRHQIARRIDELQTDPEKRGKPLLGELAGIYSLRAAGQRYRVLYRIERERVIVYVVALGIRKEGNKRDVYSLARRLLRLGLIDPPTRPRT
jgi:mRNA interferase RelE/StbE